MFKTTKPYYITMGIALLVMIISIVVSSFGGNSSASEIEQQEAQIAALENEIAAQSAAISSGNANVVSNATGIEISRVQHDDEIAKGLIQRMTTWNSYEEYCAIRYEVMDKYGLVSNSHVMKVFFPEYPDIQDMSGNSYNFIDYYKLSCSYSGMKSMVRGISDSGKYSYFTIVSCKGIRNGNGGSFSVAFLYSVDANGTISEFDAYTLDGYRWVE